MFVITFNIIISGSFDAGSRSWPRGPGHFGLGKKPKPCQQKCFFVAHGLCSLRRSSLNKSGKTTGCDLFAGLLRRFITLHAKSRYALCQFTGRLFFRIFPEAVLLTEENGNNISILF